MADFQYQIGCHAEYVAVPWLKTFPIPEGISLEVGCASSLQGVYSSGTRLYAKAEPS